MDRKAEIMARMDALEAEMEALETELVVLQGSITKPDLTSSSYFKPYRTPEQRREDTERAAAEMGMR